MSTNKVGPEAGIELNEAAKSELYEQPIKIKLEDVDEEKPKLSLLGKLKKKRQEKKEAKMVPFFQLVSNMWHAF
jgi:hypothetical protein